MFGLSLLKIISLNFKEAMIFLYSYKTAILLESRVVMTHSDEEIYLNPVEWIQETAVKYDWFSTM